jgi:hypothetical protein
MSHEADWQDAAMGMTTVDGLSPEFSNYSDEELAAVLRRAETDLRLSRNDPARHRRVQAIFESALLERHRRLESRDAEAPG